MSFDAKAFLLRERDFSGFIGAVDKSHPRASKYVAGTLEARANNDALNKHPDAFHGFTYMRKVDHKGALPFAVGEIVVCDCGAPCKVNEASVGITSQGALPNDWVFIGNNDLHETWYDNDNDCQACGGCEQ